MHNLTAVCCIWK